MPNINREGMPVHFLFCKNLKTNGIFWMDWLVWRKTHMASRSRMPYEINNLAID